MQQELEQRIRSTPNLPSMPAVAMQVLELAQRPDIDIAQIARIISKDAALSSKILRTVNSSFYGRSQHVATISHALVILGLQSVKTLVLGFSLASNLAKSPSRGFKHVAYWKRSIVAATAARGIAAKIDLLHTEEVFLAALLMDIGMLVLDQVLGEQYGAVFARAATHADLPALERDALGATHAEVGGLLAEQWKLPPLLSIPIAHHHDDPAAIEDPTLRKVTELVALAGRCADVFADENPSAAIADVRRAALEQFQLDAAACDALLAEVGKRTKEVASLFEINIGSTQQYEAILQRANQALVELTLQSQMQASQLQQQNQQLQHRATTDALTGLANRAAFDDALAKLFAAAAGAGQPLSLLMLDLDGFKEINDGHGHPAGDAVLRAVGALLARSAGPQDVAARYGGDEMVLLLPRAPRAIAKAAAESLRSAIAARSIRHGSIKMQVTASIGVATFDTSAAFRTPAHLIKAADTALYNAKRAGRNCVELFAAKSTTPAAA
jgi:diguanylate cyclase (GGDEF)-like protein